MNFFTTLRIEIVAKIRLLMNAGFLPSDLDLSKITVEPPRDPSHGDIATNAAMVLSKASGIPPRELAAKFAEEISQMRDVENVEIAGPGFINMRLNKEFWIKRLEDIIRLGKQYGESDLGIGRKINLEYVSANPTGPIHAGHGRVAVVADALANLLEKVGYVVLREYYVNDAGGQAEKLAKSTYLRYREALGENIGEIPEGCYPGEYLMDVGQAIAKRDGDKWMNVDESEWRETFREFAVSAMMADIKKDLEVMGISHDVFSSEMELQRSGAVQAVVDELDKKGLLYTGVLEPPKGKVIEDWEPRPQLLFKATDFGDDVDRPLKKSDGSWTYFTNDIAYHFDKFKRGYEMMIDVWGADHGGYVKRITSAVDAITGGKGKLDVVLAQIVNFSEDGVPVKMSKRAGTFVTVRDVIEKVGRDVFRFMMVSRKSDAHLEFDFKKVMDQSKDNPVFYVNYAYARCHSVQKMAVQQFPNLDVKNVADADLSLLDHPEELRLIKHLAGWPRQVEIAAEAHEPHRLCYYLYEIAAHFHSLWNLGKEDAILRFVLPNDLEKTKARLAMLQAVTSVIASGLEIFGVEPVEEMRE